MLDNRNFFCLFFNSLTIGKDESDLPAHSGGARSEASLGWNTIEKHYHCFRWDFWSIPSINYQFKLIWWHYLLPMTPLDWQRLTLTHSWIFKRVWRTLWFEMIAHSWLFFWGLQVRHVFSTCIGMDLINIAREEKCGKEPLPLPLIPNSGLQRT